MSFNERLVLVVVLLGIWNEVRKFLDSRERLPITFGDRMFNAFFAIPFGAALIGILAAVYFGIGWVILGDAAPPPWTIIRY